MRVNAHMPITDRIHPLAIGVWRAGVYPMSWSWQCGPEFTTAPSPADLETAMYAAGYLAAKKLEHDNALVVEVARAREILAGQGKVLAETGAVVAIDLADPEGFATVETHR